MSRDLQSLHDMMDAIVHIETYTAQGRVVFMASRLLRDAVLRNFEILGEASRRLTPEIRKRYSDVPWGEMVGMRNILIHAYDDVDLEEVWRTIECDLPPLKAQITRIIAETEAGA